MRTSHESLQKLADFVRRSQLERPRKRVTVLPDLFADQIISIQRTPSQFLSEAAKIASRGGGNYTGVSAQLTRGGCAANCAAALSALEVPTSLISSTSALGVYLLKHASNPTYLDMSHVKTSGKLAATVSLETRERGRVFNIMISDPGSLARFSERSLNQADFAALKNSAVVGLFSWNLIDRGTELIERATSFCSENGVRTYVDLGDPTPRIHKLPTLFNRVFRRGLVDYLSVNENELRAVSKSLAIRNWRHGPLRELATDVTNEFPVELALHTPDYAGLITAKEAVFCSTFEVALRRSTGAGDAWNAGNIFGILRGARAEVRLMMANLLAALYVSSPKPEIHSIRSIAGFLRRARLKGSGDLP